MRIGFTRAIKLVMDIQTQRLRFIEYQPQPVNCLAFCDLGNGNRLAVSRADASLEIWATTDGLHYYKDLFIPGRSDTSIEALVWSKNRLFSAGLTGTPAE